MDSPEGFPKAALPWLQAVMDWSVATVMAVCLGDWDGLQPAYDALVAEETRFRAAAIPARSGAATELDYYGGEA